MSRLAILALLVLILNVGPALGQTTAAPPPAPAKPQISPAPLPAESKFAFVNLQVVFNESSLGKQGQERWRVLNEKLFAGLSARDKEIQGLTEKIKTQQGVLDQAVLSAWNNELQRLRREAQFAQQEAQVQSEQLQQEVLASFEKQILPVIDAIRAEKGLLAVFAVQQDSGGLTLLSSDRGLDLSPEVVRRLNAK